MNFNIINKNEINDFIQEYNFEKEGSDYLHLCFAHPEDAERAIENEISESETIEVKGYFNDLNEYNAQGEDFTIIMSLDVKYDFWYADPASVIIYLEKLELQNLPDAMPDFYAGIWRFQDRFETPLEAAFEAQRDLADDAL
jgi:hypothetical protein